MEDKRLLALDIGSSGVRAALFDGAGRMLPRTLVSIERTLSKTADGGAELDAASAVKQTIAAIDAVLENAPKDAGITHIASCTFWHGLVGVDAAGKPTTKIFGWADNRSRLQVKKLRNDLNERTVHDRTGAMFHSSFWPAKLLWLKKEFPDVWKRTAAWISPGDLLTRHFCNVDETSVSMASGTGIFDIRELKWDAELLKYLKINDTKLPQIARSDDAAFSLLPKFQKKWPLLKDAKWLLPVADGAANSIGSGCTDDRTAALMVGTSGAMRVISSTAPKNIPQGLWCYRVDRKRFITGGALSDGGGSYAWLKENLNLPKDAEKIIAKRKPASGGITFLPFLAGERSTGYNEDAAGAILGLMNAHQPIDILQAAMESAAYRFAEIYKRLQSIYRVESITASGGALLNSSIWPQIIADVLGQNIHLSTINEASLRGTVLLALESIGKIDIINSDKVKFRKIGFRQQHNGLHKAAIKRHKNYYDLIINRPNDNLKK